MDWNGSVRMEGWRSSVEQRWVEHADGLPVQTGWALLALLSAHAVGAIDARDGIERAAGFLLARQTPAAMDLFRSRIAPKDR